MLDADRFDVLAALIEAFEAKHWPIEPADPIDAIRYRMEMAGFSQADLGLLIGSKSRVSGGFESQAADYDGTSL